jgi:hypothetical protein
VLRSHGDAKPREWGPSVETDEGGREFHYRVNALTLSGRSVLIFSLDTASDQMRQVLQKSANRRSPRSSARRMNAKTAKLAKNNRVCSAVFAIFAFLG